MNFAWAGKAAASVTPASVLKYGGAVSLAAGLPLIAYSAAHAAHGEALAEASSSAIGIATYPAGAYLATAALGFIPGVGPMARLAAPLIGLALAHSPAAALSQTSFRAVRQFTQFGRRVRRLECGGDYRDTALAQSMRQRAMTEMSGSLVQARRVLGQEARFMHE